MSKQHTVSFKINITTFFIFIIRKLFNFSESHVVEVRLWKTCQIHSNDEVFQPFGGARNESFTIIFYLYLLQYFVNFENFDTRVGQ